MPKPAAARTASVPKEKKTPPQGFLSRNSVFPVLILLIVIVIVGIALAVGDTKDKPKPAAKDTVTGACGPYRHDGSVVIDGQKIFVEAARNSTEFEKGLAGRPCIPADQGMFFSFSKEGRYPFWMKGMKFPIDIVWITSGHRVAAIEVDEQPSTFPDKFVNKIPAMYVLELKANRSKELNMEIGSAVSF
jgi:uncharacterized membrane protein (UPF0127 family)